MGNPTSEQGADERAKAKFEQRPVYVGMFAIRAEDALSWHKATKEVAGVSARSGFHVRAYQGQWYVWAIESDFAALQKQTKGD